MAWYLSVASQCGHLAWPATRTSARPGTGISDSLVVSHAKMHAPNVYFAYAVNFEKYISFAKNVLAGLPFLAAQTPTHDLLVEYICHGAQLANLTTRPPCPGWGTSCLGKRVRI